MKKYWKRILAILLILAMTAGDSAVSYAVENTDSSEETYTEEESETGEESEADDGGTDEDAADDENTGGSDGETAGASASENDVTDDSGQTGDDGSGSGDESQTEDTDNESEDEAASESTTQEEESVSEDDASEGDETEQIVTAYEEFVSGDAWVSDETLQTNAASAISEEAEEETSASGYYGAQLADDANALGIYNAMVAYYATKAALTDAACEVTLVETVTFSATVDSGVIVQDDNYEAARTQVNNAVDTAFHAFWQDYPEAFWFSSILASYGISCSYNTTTGIGTGTISTITLTANEHYTDAMGQITEYWDAVDAIVEELSPEGMSSYEIVKSIHDYLCDTLTYNTAAAANSGDDTYNYAHTSSTAFLGYTDPETETDVGKKVVCDGYAKAFKVLCDEMGIDCLLVSGYGRTDSEGTLGAHAWNYVQLEENGAWYLVDVTWDDQTSGIYYTYFLAGGASAGFYYTISEDHIPCPVACEDENFSFTYPTLSTSAYTPSEEAAEESLVELYGIADENDPVALEGFSSLESAVAEVAAYTDDEAYTEFLLKLQADVTLSDSLSLSSGTLCALDLNGYQLTVSSDAAIALEVYDSSAARSGSVAVEKDVSLTLQAANGENTTYDIPGLSFDTTSTMGGLTLESADVSLNVDTMTLGGTFSATGGSTLSIRDAAVIQDLSVTAGSKDAEDVYEPFYINLDSVYLSGYVSEPYSEGTLCIEGTLTKAEELEYAVSLQKRSVTVTVRTQAGYEEAEIESASFGSGDTAVTVSLADEEIPTAYFCLTENEDNQQCLWREDSQIRVYDVAVRVKYGYDSYDYPSFDLAISNLASAFGSQKGTYTFTFVHDTKMTANVALPSYVTRLYLTADSDENGNYSHAEFDFGGYTLSSAYATVILHEGLSLMNSSDSKNGTLSLTATPSTGQYSFQIVTFEEGEVADEDGTLLVDGVNITASKGSVALGEAAEETTSSYTLVNSVITTKQLYVYSCDWTVGTLSSASIENYGTLRVQTAKTISTLDNKSGAAFVCGSFVQSSSGKTYLEADSTFVVQESATIYNTVLGGQTGETDGCAYFYRDANASVSFLTKVSQTNENVYLKCGIVSIDEDGTWTLQDAEPRTSLFTTKISSFPVSYFEVEQPDENSSYTLVYQNGQNICVGGEWIRILVQNTDGSETLLDSFTRWTDAQSYLNTLYNTSTTYIVELTDDVIIEESLTMPTKVGELIFRGAGSDDSSTESDSSDDRVIFSFVGNLTLKVNTTFENIDLQPTKYSSSSGEYEPYAAVVTLNGKNLTLKNVQADAGYIDYIKGTTASTLTVEDSEITTSRYLSTIGTVSASDSTFTVGTSLSWNSSAIASVKYLDLTKSSLKAQGTVAVTNTLTMESSTLDTNGKMSLVNVVSNSEDNVIGFGGNISTKILTITGTVTTAVDDMAGEVEVTISGSTEETTATAKVRKAALSVIVHSLAGDDGAGYSDGDVLLNAAKASASWFVIGKTISSAVNEETGDTETTVTVQYTSYKSGSVIYCGDAVSEAAVVLSSWDAAANDYVTDGGYATLQEAFSEIDRLADTSAKYQITLQDDEENVVSKTSTNLTFPTKTAGVVIVGTGEDGSKVYFKSAITLKSSVTFENIVLSPQSSATIALSAWSLELDSCSVAEGKKITAISGSGVSGNSSLTISGNDLTVSGTVSGVGNVHLKGVTLTALSTVNIGNLYAETASEKDAALIGYATVTRKNGYVTAVSTTMTINGDVYAADGVTLGLQEKVSGEYRTLDLADDEMKNMWSSGVKLAKALKVSTMQVRVLLSEGETGEASENLVKSSGYLIYTTTEPGVLLSYTDASERSMETSCLTIAQASTEINNLKTKRDYTMTLTEEIADRTSSSYTALTMPTASYVSRLVIDGTISQESESGESTTTAATVYFTGSITLTTNMTLKNVNLVRMVKSGSSYYSTAEKARPAIMTLSVGAYTLDIRGDVSFHTPLSITGSSKGTLLIETDARLYTETNGYELSDAGDGESLVCGSITKFAQITVKSGQTLIIREYTTNGSSYTAPSLSVTTLNNRGEILLESHAKSNYAASVSVTSAVFLNGTLDVEGSATFTNLTLSGESEVTVDKTFKITGTLTSTTSEAYLYTRRQGKNKAPYLNVSGTVVLEDESSNQIHVGVYPVVTDQDSEVPVVLKGSPSVTGQLLTAKSASADCFIPWDENVAFREAYSADQSNGYILKKSGTAIYVYQSDEIVVALCEGEYSDLATAETDGTVLDYYPSFSDAVSAINTLKDSGATYTLLLLEDVGDVSSPLSITLPTYAKNVYVTSQKDSNGDARSIYYKNTLTLKCATVFNNVIFAPMKSKNTGTSLGFSTGVYDLTLKNVEVSDELSTMKLSSISGNAKQTTTLDSENLTLTGNVQNSLYLKICQSATIKGVVKTTNLSLEGGVTLTTGSTVTLTNVQNNGEGQNTLAYGRTTGKVTYLTISGTVSGDNDDLLVLNMLDSSVTASNLLLTLSSVSYTKTSLSNTKKLANITKAPTSVFSLQLNSESLESDSYQVVKAGKALYLTDGDTMPAAVTLVYEKETENEDGTAVTETYQTACLDWYQAVSEITAIADSTMDYTILLSEDVEDTNITDSYAYSSLSMPGSKKAASVTVSPQATASTAAEDDGTEESESQERTMIQFYGNITAYGVLILNSIQLVSTYSYTKNTSMRDFKITVAKSGSTAALTLNNVSTWADDNSTGDAETTGFISQIVGTNNYTDVKLTNCNLRLKTGISSIGDLTLDNTALTTCGATTIHDLYLDGESSWDALGKTSITNVVSSGMTGGYLGTKQTAKLLSQLTITGTVSDPLLFRVATAGCATYAVEYLDNDSYSGTVLAVALKADAEMFIAAPYGEWAEDSSGAKISDDYTEELIAYKDSSGYVYNGFISDMAVSIRKEASDEGETSSIISYATSFYEAVSIINNAADTSADYTIQFLSTESGDGEDYVWIGTAKNGGYGSLTLPTKAASVTISGAVDTDGSLRTLFCYTGTLTPRCNVTFENILLTEGTYSSKTGKFTPSYSVTPKFGSYNYELTFAATAATLTNSEEEVSEADLVFSYVSGTKGKLTVEDRSVYVRQYVSVPTLNLKNASSLSALSYVKATSLRLEDAALDANSYITVTNLVVQNLNEDQYSELTSLKAMKLTTLTGEYVEETDKPVLRLNTYFTTITKASQRSATQLTVSGAISGVSVQVAPYMYELSSQEYHAMTATEAAALNVYEGKTLSSYDRIAVLTKASTEDITVLMYDDSGFMQAAYQTAEENGTTEYYSLYKYDGGLYLTDQEMKVQLVGHEDSLEGETNYQADFLDWAQAVKEIDRIADTGAYYDILLLDDIGADSTPMGTVSMPTKAAGVRIAPYAEEDCDHGEEETTETRYLFFTGTTLTIRCDTTFENVGLIALKKTTVSGVTSYVSTSFNIAGSSWDLILEKVPGSATLNDTTYESLVGTINGNSKGSFTFSEGSADTTLTAVATKLTNYGKVTFSNETQNSAALTISGSLSGVTNLILNEDVELCVSGGALTATNLTMTECALTAKNITSTGTVTLQNAQIAAGTDTVGDGIVKLGTIECLGENQIFAKQSKAGASQLTITGYVSCGTEEEEEDEGTENSSDPVIEVGLYYNNSCSKLAQLYDGMTLLTAKKASASWFRPYYTTDAEDEEDVGTDGMGKETENYGLVKSGSAIKYTDISSMEVELHYLNTADGESVESGNTLFATFEEAVTEINNLSRYRTGTKVYEDYEIELLKDVEIGNTSGNGSYSSLTLPTKAGNVRIYSDENGDAYTISYAGTLTLRCNTEFENVGLYSIKSGEPTAVNYALSKYTLTLDGVSTTDEENTVLVAAVTGSTGSELALRGNIKLYASGKLSVYQICFEEAKADETIEAVSEEDADPCTTTLRVDGTLTATLIYLNGNVDAVIQKPESSTFTLNGASLDVDGDGTKENVSVISETEDDADDLQLTVQLMEKEIAAGTKILTCKYLDLDHYIVTDENDFDYPTYQSGNYLVVGHLVADKTLADFTAEDGTAVTYKLNKSVFDYTGSEIVPQLILQCNGETLVEGEHYELAYESNTDPGTGTITVTAIEGSGYKGEGTISFTIRKKSLSSWDIEIIFDGSLTKDTVDSTTTWIPGVQVTDTRQTGNAESVVLYEAETEDADNIYTLSYRIESDGSVSAVLSGSGDYYRGTVVKNFAKVSATTTYTLKNCIAADTGSDTSAGAVDRTSETQLLIKLSVSGSALAGLTNLYILEMDNQGDDVVGYVGNAEAVYSETSNITTLTATLTWSETSSNSSAIIDNFNSSMMDRYALVAVVDDGYQIISKSSMLVQNPEVTAVTIKKYTSYYTYSDGERDIDSKKGMQGTSGYAGDLGVSASLININLNEIIKSTTNVKKYGSSAYVPYVYKGKTYYFLNMVAYQNTIYSLNGWDGGASYGLSGSQNVTVDLLLAWDDELTYLIHPSARVKGYSYYALNMQEEKARLTFEAMFSYLGYKLGGSKYTHSAYKYRVQNWTLGNEVNCCQAWNYSGNLSTSDCAANYAEAFQLLYQAIRRSDAYARIFISLDHSWTASTEGHSGKSYLDSFAAYMYKTAPQMAWNVNYHPYSQPLTRVDFWNDSSNTTSSTSTPYISMQNLSVLTNYLGTLETKYKMASTCVDTRASTEKGYIRVILGEQGYTARYGYSSEESLQVTALQKLHSIAMANTRVDAYMNRSYVDDASEAAGGLYLGLMNTSEKKKSSYAAFKKL